MGKVRPTAIKRASQELVELYADRFSIDFEENKKVIDELAEIGSKKVRNRTAGYVTRLMRRKADIEARSVIDLPEGEEEE
ncbi:MAG: 30S ribosomal protein S17e [Candidatus Heimdallarchaeota archaeon]